MNSYAEKRLKNLSIAYELAKAGYTVRAGEICREIVKEGVTPDELDKHLDRLRELKDALDDLKSDIEFFEDEVKRDDQN